MLCCVQGSEDGKPSWQPHKQTRCLFFVFWTRRDVQTLPVVTTVLRTWLQQPFLCCLCYYRPLCGSRY